MINNLLMRLAGMQMQRILIGSLILGVLYYFTMFNDGSTIKAQIKTVEADIQKEEVTAKASDAAIKEVEQIRTAVAELSEQFKMVSQAMPSEIQMSDMIRAVDTTSRASGVSVKTKEPKPIVNHGYYEEIPLRITMEGNFSEITMFLYYMASQERIMKVNRFMMQVPNVADKNISPGRLFFDGQVVSFKYIGEKEQPVPTPGRKGPRK